MIYNTGRLMGPHTTMTWSQLIDIIDDTEAVVRRLGLRPSGYAAAVKATLLLAAARGLPRCGRGLALLTAFLIRRLGCWRG